MLVCRKRRCAVFVSASGSLNFGSLIGFGRRLFRRRLELDRRPIKPEMVGHYLGDFSITYKPVRHGRPGIGSTNSSRFIPLK
ncbi:hypothetical protein M885DRAFT_570350 [Pelagophyceae sp. CCMP2097]|nr:hypothetical protein M885DRAFT_570350 [Pelagophyceae sp. CCMP2097]